MKLSGWTKEKADAYVDNLVKDCQYAAELRGQELDFNVETYDERVKGEKVRNKYGSGSINTPVGSLLQSITEIFGR